MYFVMTYFIIRGTLIMIYLFYNLHKKLNKTNGQTRYLKVKNITYSRMEGVRICACENAKKRKNNH